MKSDSTGKVRNDVPRKGARWMVAAIGTVLSASLLGGCGSSPIFDQDKLVQKARQDPSSLLIVDCALPPRVVSQGLAMTYLAPGEALKTTALDCGIRGGKYVAYDRANYATALEVWLGKAKAGDAEAQTNVGEIYEKGLGLTPDYATAAKWYEKAAAQGYSRAEINLGYLYEQGLGVPKDLVAALNWYRKASGLTDDSLTFASSIETGQPPQLAEARAEIQALRGELAESRREIDALRQGLGASRSELEQSREKLRQTLDSLEKARSELDQARRAPAGQQREQLPRMEQDFEAKQKQARTEIEHLKRLQERYQRENSALQDKLAKAEHRASALNSEVDKNRFEMARLEAKLAETEASLEKAKLEYAAKQTNLATAPVDSGKQKELEDRLARRESELKAQQARIAELERQMARAAEDRKALQEQAESSTRQDDKQLEMVSRRLDSATRELDSEKAKSAALEQGIKRLAAEREALRSSQAGKDTEIQRLAGQISNYTQQLERLRNELKRAKDREPPASVASAAGPRIELIDPPLTAVPTRGVPVIKLRSLVASRPITGNAYAPAGIKSFIINDRSEKVSDTGMFKSEVRLLGKETPVNITLIDNRAGKASLDFLIISPEPTVPPPTVAEQPGLPGNLNFGKYYALVIGNNRYQHNELPSLDTPINDATAVGQVLKERYGFEITALSNATRYDILTALNRFRDKLKEQDNLLIYYAGHGELDKVNQRGQWLPVDAERGNTANWISTDAITDILNTIPAKHILVVADSCYSGAMTRTALAMLEPNVPEATKVKWLKTMLEHKSRTVLTSGGLEPVLDTGSGGHSMFAKAFIDALAGNEDILPGQTLFRKVSEQVKQAAERFRFEQIPQYAPIRYADHEASDFFFVPKTRLSMQ